MTTAERDVFKTSESGEWVRETASLREWVSADGSTGFKAEPGRYHLYVCAACPWAHRAVIVRELKGLGDVVSMSFVDPYRDERGWTFREENGGQEDPVNGFSYLSEAYDATASDYEGRWNVPVLWDRETGRIVNNESADVIVMLNSAWDEWAENPGLDLYPAEHREEIDETNRRVYERVNNGVYRAGFAGSQSAYEAAAGPLFEELDSLERRLADRRFLIGDSPTLADWRLFTTLVRFDSVYYVHFKCNLWRIVDYPRLWDYTRDLLSIPGVRQTLDIDQIKLHYYTTHPQINPTRFVPIGPMIDWDAPQDRALLG
ncbi:glutathione S-transferase family protein [Thermoleophilia bacterium SCSIO 60948]|nr:glutathione S-transferase family protein [Thermoleophilia bacterium SCSIO 60948]